MSLCDAPYPTLAFGSRVAATYRSCSELAAAVCIVVSACTGVCSNGHLLYRAPLPKVPKDCFLSVQGVYSPFASLVAQRYADREELGSDDSEDTAVMTPTKNQQAMPTVNEDLSQELPPESYDVLRKAEGMIDGSWLHCIQCHIIAHSLMTSLTACMSPMLCQGKTSGVLALS